MPHIPQGTTDTVALELFDRRWTPPCGPRRIMM